jgi:hypothetical protein
MVKHVTYHQIHSQADNMVKSEDTINFKLKQIGYHRLHDQAHAI